MYSCLSNKVLLKRYCEKRLKTDKCLLKELSYLTVTIFGAFRQ